MLLLLTLTGLLSVVHFSIQPRIDRLLAQAEGDTMPQAVAAGIAPLRLKRKTTLILVGLAGLFTWRVSAPESVTDGCRMSRPQGGADLFDCP